MKNYQYDKQGNMLSDGSNTYSYDGFNRVAEVRTAEDGIQKNHYDAEGLRHEMEENGKLVKFLYNENREVEAEEEASGNIIRYVRGLGLISSDSESARTYYHYVSDEQGSVTHVLEGEGKDGSESKQGAASNILNRYTYDAFGNTIDCEEQVHNRFRYNGEQYDPVTSQYYLRARFYNPAIARFTQEDTYYGDGLNLYQYCANNPVVYKDPSGHNICSVQQDLYHKKCEEYMKENGLTDSSQIPKDQKKRMYDEMRTELGKKIESGYKASGTGPDKVPGVEVQFNYKAKFDEAEFKRQLENQQNGMNKLTVEEYLRNRAEYKANGRSKEGTAAQREARQQAYQDKVTEYRKTMSYSDAKKTAEKWIKTQAALHDPDQIAGGNPLNITGMGDARINSSIGSQWKTRIDSIDKYVNELASHLTDEQKKTTYLNVKLSYGGK